VVGVSVVVGVVVLVVVVVVVVELPEDEPAEVATSSFAHAFAPRANSASVIAE
jgi:hypothetical protein